jgi:hypothetical protein
LSDSEKYQEIEELKLALKRHQISFTTLPRQQKLDSIFYRRIQVILEGKDFELPVCDEYEDVDEANPLVLLHLLLREIEYYEDAEDYLVWCEDTGLKAEDELSRSIWFELREVAPKIRRLFGSELKAIDDFDFEMNTGITKALRNSRV